MNEDNFNMNIRKFLKKVGISAQREITNAVKTAIADGRLKGTETLPASVKLILSDIDLELDIEENIALE